MTGETEGAKSASPWLKNNLVKLGSAAVFTVYSAGYFRTRDAAERFAGESVQRHAAAIAAPQGNANVVSVHTEAPHADKAELPVMRLSSTATKAAGNTAGNTATDARGRVPEPAVARTADTPAPPASAATATPTPAPTPASVPVPAPAQPSIPSAPAVDSTAPAKKDENAPLKDGVYYGWGTSRHGDIQASVEIKSGKIVGAYISQCLTQYSCSWVSALPGQVVQRQNAEVDYVSGATQSSNAFYYAVIDALKKAK
jgi:uncharacterized protein with FMN-binding domain